MNVILDFSGSNTSLMITAAHRYCLGRSSYIAGACVEWMILHWDSIDPATQATMLRDTIEAIANDRAGHKTDKQDWTRFTTTRLATLTPDQMGWLRNAIRHDEKAREWLEQLELRTSQ